MHLLLRTAFLFLLPCAAAAQETLRPPADSLVVAEFDGPMRWREAFAATNLGRWLGSPEVTRQLAPYWEQLDRSLAGTGAKAAKGELTPKAIWDAWCAYRGRVTVAFDLDVAGLDTESSMPPFWVAVIASGDGKTDLRGIAARLQTQLEGQNQKALRDVTVGNRRLRVVAERNSPVVTVPFLCGEDLVMLVASPGDRMLQNFFTRASGTGATRADSNLRITADGARLGRVVHQLVQRTQNRNVQAAAIGQTLTHLGLDAVGAFELTVRADGATTRCDVSLALKGGAKAGVFELFRPARPRLALLDFVPRASRDWGVFAFRAGALRGWLAGLAEILEPVSGVTMAQIDAQIAAALGFELGDGLLAHLGDEVIYHGSRRAPAASAQSAPKGRRVDPTLDDFCFGFELKNGPAVTQAIERLLQNERVTATSETLPGAKAWQVAVGPIQVQLAVSNRLLLIGTGQNGRTVLREVLAEEQARQRGEQPARFPDAVENRLREAATPVLALGAADVPKRVENTITAFESTHLMNRQLRQLVQFVRPLLAGMKAAGLEFLVQTGRFDGSRIAFRTTF